MSTAVKRACDACHRRKVKCDGLQPCRNCDVSQLECTFNAVPQKKGPKGSRAKVISELRENQTRAQVQNRNAAINESTSIRTLEPTPGLLTGDMIKSCIHFYFAHIYSAMPILSPAQLAQSHIIDNMYFDNDMYCVLTALCAFITMQPGMVLPGMGAPTDDPYDQDMGACMVTSSSFLNETERVRKNYEYTQKPTLNTICTSYLLFACYYGLGMHPRAWFYLREATTLAHLEGLGKEDTYANMDPVDALRARRLYWLLFVAERAYALQDDRPLSLQPSIRLPHVAFEIAEPLVQQHASLHLMAQLFHPFDHAFVAVLNQSRSKVPPAYLRGLEEQLSELPPSYMNDRDTQHGELVTNQRWLNAMAQHHGNVSANLQQSVDMLGLSEPNLAKLLSIASNLTHVLSLQPASRSPFSFGPRELLHPLLNVLSAVRNGDCRFMPLVLKRVHDVLPMLANPMLKGIPDDTPNMGNMGHMNGIFEAGMAQPRVFGGPSAEYETKYNPPAEDYGMDSTSAHGGAAHSNNDITSIFGEPSAEYETKYNPPAEDFGIDSSSAHGGAAHSNNDVTSPYISSPLPAASSGADYPHGLPDASFNPINPMADVVMQSGVIAMDPSHTPPHTSHPQHQQHSMHSLNAHVQTGMNTGMGQTPNVNLNQQSQGPGNPFDLDHNLSLHQIPNSGMYMAQNMNANSMIMNGQAPSRAASFALSPGPQQVTAGSFQALQRACSDMNPMNTIQAMNHGLGRSMDFMPFRGFHRTESEGPQ